MDGLSRAQLDSYDPQGGRKSGGQLRWKCPIHGGDRQRSLTVNPDTGAYVCHNCGASGLLADYKSDRPRSARRAARVPSPAWMRTRQRDPDPESVAGFLRVASGMQPLADSPAAAYLEGRAVPLDVALAAHAKFHPGVNGKASVVFPIAGEAGASIALQARFIVAEGTDKCRTYGPLSDGVFVTGPDALDADALAICEAPIDALSLAAIGMPGIALCGVNPGGRWPDWLPRRLRFRTVYLAFDLDDGGKNAAPAMTAALQAYGARVVLLPPPAVDGGKDWNDALQSVGTDALREYLESTIGAPQAGGLPKTAAQEARTAPAPPADVSEDPPDLLPGEAEILALLDAGLVTQDAAEAVLSDIFAGRPTPEPACPAPPASTQWESAFADRLPAPEPAAVDELRDRILAALEHTRALRPGESVSDPERYAAREAADALSPYPALAIGARTRLAHLGVSLPAA